MVSAENNADDIIIMTAEDFMIVFTGFFIAV
jgi:hypothetical protein